MNSTRTPEAPPSVLQGCLRLATVLLLACACAPLAVNAAAEHATVVISTEKPLGPVPGTFVASGAFSDSGVVTTQGRVVSALPSPFGVVSHLVLRFDGENGSFVIRTEIIETVTDDPNVFANSGVWAIVDGSGAYARLHGTGDVEGSVDDVANLIARVFVGDVLQN